MCIVIDISVTHQENIIVDDSICVLCIFVQTTPFGKRSNKQDTVIYILIGVDLRRKKRANIVEYAPYRFIVGLFFCLFVGWWALDCLFYSCFVSIFFPIFFVRKFMYVLPRFRTWLYLLYAIIDLRCCACYCVGVVLYISWIVYLNRMCQEKKI